MEERIVGAHAPQNKLHASGVVMGYVAEKIGLILRRVVTDQSVEMDITFVFYLRKVTYTPWDLYCMDYETPSCKIKKL